MYQYKAVKNVQRPGRPPSGFEWVKENGVAVTNDKGELAYQPKSETAPKKASKKTAGRKKSAAKGKKAVEVPESSLAALTLKKTYAALPYESIVKINKITESLLEKAKEARKAELEKIIDKTKKELAELK
ncbi:MAG: hypothetical protein JJU05_10775 [Verrucomicrobia bacterium]|nr:hypothetical protein [Verrucomicrobiota bacterium]MCH8528617.1 hypothetical protein [Kiritimatiellia bacterium]